MNWRRVWRLIKKELLQTRRDKRIMGMVFMAPIMQMLLFGYAVTSDVNHVVTAVLDDDRTTTSRVFVDRFMQSGYFEYKRYLSAPAEIDQVLDTGKAQMVLHIPRGFASDLGRGRTAQVQVIFDGTDSTTARVASGYTDALVQQYAGQITFDRLDRAKGAVPRLPRVEGRVRVWYNPELKSINFMLPGLLCTIIMFVTTILTSLAIVKEKELGTLEQLVVTPVTPRELMIGKTVPFLIIGLLIMTVTLTVAIFWFHVRVAGSIPLLIAISALFLLTTLGLGTFISTISHTQQEATLTTFFFLLPSVLLSGFVFPLENMPKLIQWVTYLIPLRYFLQIIRGLFLKGNGLAEFWPQVVVLAAFGVGILLISAWRFSKRLG